MSWKRIATFAAGGAAVVVGCLVPGAQVLVAAGTGLVALATRWPEDRKLLRAAALHGVQPDGTRVRANGEVVAPPPARPPQPPQ